MLLVRRWWRAVGPFCWWRCGGCPQRTVGATRPTHRGQRCTWPLSTQVSLCGGERTLPRRSVIVESKASQQKMDTSSMLLMWCLKMRSQGLLFFSLFSFVLFGFSRVNLEDGGGVGDEHVDAAGQRGHQREERSHQPTMPPPITRQQHNTRHTPHDTGDTTRTGWRTGSRCRPSPR